MLAVLGNYTSGFALVYLVLVVSLLSGVDCAAESSFRRLQGDGVASGPCPSRLAVLRHAR